jgi:drug/metabolite transporter (DMT)-like permease
MNTFFWLGPTLAALLLYGVGQGLVKKWIGEVPPRRYCLYLLFAKALVNIGFFFANGAPSFNFTEGRNFFLVGTFAYALEGAGWILYFESVKKGPITIVGTLSAAYPGLTVLFARFFLNEALATSQYVGVAMLVLGCIGLAYSPDDGSEGKKQTDKSWIPLGIGALVLWGAAQTIVKYAYSLPEANEVSLALFATLGGALTLGAYGIKGHTFKSETKGEWLRSFTPMMMMGGGDLAVLVATKTGPVSVVTPLSGSYPIVTLIFAWLVLKERIAALHWACFILILAGIYLSPGST